MQAWLIENWLQAGTLLTVLVLFIRIGRWSGRMDARMEGLENWRKQHVQFHGGTP